MILFTVLLVVAAIFLVLLLFTAGAVGITGLVVFAEPIICIALIVLIVKLFRNKKKQKK